MNPRKHTKRIATRIPALLLPSPARVQAVLPAFGGRPCSFITPASASNSGSLWISTASSRCAVAATNASAKETLCAAFNFAASPQSASSECNHWTGCCFTHATNLAADSAPCSFARMYWSSVSETKEEWMATRPSHAAATCASTSSAPGSLSASANQAEVSSTTLSTRPLLGAIFQQRLQQTFSFGMPAQISPEGSTRTFFCVLALLM